MKHLINIGVPVLTGLLTLVSLGRERPWSWPYFILLAILTTSVVYLSLFQTRRVNDRLLGSLASGLVLTVFIWTMGSSFHEGTYITFVLFLCGFMITRLYSIPNGGDDVDRYLYLLAALILGGIFVTLGASVWSTAAAFGYAFTVAYWYSQKRKVTIKDTDTV